jgi:chromate transporter
VCFITPAVLIILPIAWMYVTWGSLPQAGHVLGTVNAAVIGIVAAALWRFAVMALRSGFTIAIGVLATAAALASRWFPQYQPDLLILAVAAIAGALYVMVRRAATASLAAALPLALAAHDRGEMLRVFGQFLKVGATLFGSGYLLVSYLQQSFIDQHGWLTRQQLLDAFAVGQITPGPLLTTATFIGYVLGERFIGGITGAVIGAVGCTIAIFLPSFVFVGLFGRYFSAIRANAYARSALDAVNAAVVALIFVVLIRLGQVSLLPHGRLDWMNVIITAVTLIVLTRWDLNSTWLVLAAAALGWLRSRL